MAKVESIRLDQLLVDRDLVESRHKAQALILAGQVLVEEQKVDKPGRRVSAEAAVRFLGLPAKFVSRAGYKLEAALERFSVDLMGTTCLDVGASTGGFTDCMLQRGAAKVYAVDVGTNQLHWKIRQDPRVEVRERVNARYLGPPDVPEPCDFACCDVSFISVTLILPAVVALLTPSAPMIVLAKPQFEVGRADVGKGGVVRDPALRQAAADRVALSLRELGFRKVEQMESPLAGAEGNRELLLLAAERERVP
ncbi:MAG: TlyA family rRNA (cytidine-2'-O)-methyltransferase [Acidobacteria bacterium]|nr:TlyA family rRNA (cytidine-2'-O)-methyltransferase [Acidobacteriota bacterium]